MKKIFFYLMLLLLMVYGIYLRGYELSTGSFWIDEGYSSMIAFFMGQNNFLPLLPSGVYEFSQYFFHLSQVLSFSWLGISDFSARLPSFVISILHMFVFYFFTQTLLKENKYKNIAILFLMVLFLFSTWQIIWSREARFYEMLSFLYLTTTYFLYQYLQEGKNKDLTLYLTFLFIGSIFHLFFLAFFVLSIVVFWKDIFHKKHYKIGFFLILVIFLYLVSQLILKNISSQNIDISSVFPTLNSLQEYHFFSFFYYYISFLYEQLGVVFFGFLLGLGYFLFSKKYQELTLFGGLVLVNIFVISFGFFAHSRYMFHLFSLIILVGGYSMILFVSFIIEKYNYAGKKILIGLVVISLLGSIFYTFRMTFLPQRYYYIDFTSPKPNFKSAYLSLNDIPNLKIVSGFPQMCHWYFKEKPQVCQFALNINLIGSEKSAQNIFHHEKNIYTATPYLKNISDLPVGIYYFVLDDLSIKNALDTHIVQYVKDNCESVFRDIGNGEIENFIGVWKCEK